MLKRSQIMSFLPEISPVSHSRDPVSDLVLSGSQQGLKILGIFFFIFNVALIHACCIRIWISLFNEKCVTQAGPPLWCTESSPLVHTESWTRVKGGVNSKLTLGDSLARVSILIAYREKIADSGTRVITKMFLQSHQRDYHRGVNSWLFKGSH